VLPIDSLRSLCYALITLHKIVIHVIQNLHYSCHTEPKFKLSGILKILIYWCNKLLLYIYIFIYGLAVSSESGLNRGKNGLEEIFSSRRNLFS